MRPADPVPDRRAISTLWSTAREGLRRYRLRSVLSAVGVGVGTAAIVLLTSLVESASQEAARALVRLGQNRLFVVNAPPRPGNPTPRRVLSLADAVAIRRQVPEIEEVSPSVSLSVTMVACGRRRPVNVLAVGPEHLVLEDQRTVAGRYLSDLDLRGRASVAVVGYSIWQKTECLSRLRSFLQIGGQSYEVVGLLGPRGQRWGDDLDETIHIPFTTAEQRYLQSGSPVSLMATVREGASVAGAIRTIERVLGRSANGGGEGAFAVHAQTDLLHAMDALSDRVAVAMALMLSVALLMAGVGVVNSVLTSVVERTGEIGLRRAVGAKRRDIARQFLLESLAVSCGGAVGGVVSGALLAVATSRFLDLPVAINLEMVAFTLMAALLLGIACGLWPAARAARLDPTEALRHE